MKQIMLDLETMGNGADAAIIAIGAVEFDRSGVLDRFFRVVSLESSLSSGLKADASTILWWMQQGDEARSVFKQKGASLAEALVDFSAWVGGDCEVWGNGASFDNAILSTAYRKIQIEQPWKFWNDRCYRTMKNLYQHIPLKRKGTHHNAVDDAETQALHLVDILNAIGNQ